MIETHGQRQTSARYSRLGPQKCEKMHRASIEMLEHVGVEVHDDKARELLVRTNDKVETIGRETGYDNVGSFVKIFKSYMGETPKEYRLRNR